MLPKASIDEQHQDDAGSAGSVKAPVEKGDVIGTATYTHGRVLAEVPLVAAESVERSEIVQTIQQGKDIITSPWFLITAGVDHPRAAGHIHCAGRLDEPQKSAARWSRVKKYRDL